MAGLRERLEEMEEMEPMEDRRTVLTRLESSWFRELKTTRGCPSDPRTSSSPLTPLTMRT